MKTSLRNEALTALLIVVLVSDFGRAEEPKIRAKPAVEAKAAKAEPKAVKQEAVKKPQGPAAAIDAEALAAPFVEALAEKLDLNAVDAQVQQWIPQFTQQYQPVLMTELNFIRQMCDLKPEQRPKIKAVGEASVKEVVRRLAEQQGRAMRGVNFVEREAAPADPRRFIRESLAKVLKETLTEEQMAKYTEEATQRTALRKRAAIHSAVALLDSALSLTVEQRDKITESISTNWQDNWEQWLMLSMYGGQYFPTIPDPQVVTHLNDDQKSVWNGLQKVDFGFWGGDGQEQQNDGWWGDEPAKAAAPNGAIRFFGGIVEILKLE